MGADGISGHGDYLALGIYFPSEQAEQCVRMLETVVVQDDIVARTGPFAYCTTNSQTFSGFLRQVFHGNRSIGCDEPAKRSVVLERWLSGEFDTVELYTASSGSWFNCGGGAVACIVRWPRQVQLQIALPKTIERDCSLTTLARTLVTSAGCNYGHIDAGPYGYVKSLLVWEDNFWPGDDEQDRRRFQEEMEYIEGLIEDVDQSVPRATWGSILSKEHVDGLGGEEKIRQQCGCWLVERWKANLYIQLTESPWEVTGEQLRDLNLYLKPVRMVPFDSVFYPV